MAHVPLSCAHLGAGVRSKPSYWWWWISPQMTGERRSAHSGMNIVLQAAQPWEGQDDSRGLRDQAKQDLGSTREVIKPLA